MVHALLPGCVPTPLSQLAVECPETLLAVPCMLVFVASSHSSAHRGVPQTACLTCPHAACYQFERVAFKLAYAIRSICACSIKKNIALLAMVRLALDNPALFRQSRGSVWLPKLGSVPHARTRSGLRAGLSPPPFVSGPVRAARARTRSFRPNPLRSFSFPSPERAQVFLSKPPLPTDIRK